MKKSIIGILATLLIGLLSPMAEAGVRIKIATLAPDGTTWMKVMKEMAKEVKTKTGGEVTLKFYPGGVMGDEGDVIRKMRFGQVHGGGFTGRGLGEINPHERVLELPSLFKNYKEVDCVIKGLDKRLSDGFRAKGFELLGWAEAGFVYVFTNKPLKTADDIKGVKMWMWEGDPLAKALFEANGIVPVPLDLPNVLTSMQTGLIDAVYSSPYAVVALQWHTRVKYMIRPELTFATGALLVSTKEMAKMTPEHQKIVKDLAKKYLRELTLKTRTENDQAIAVLKKSGIKIIDMDASSGVSKIEQASKKVYQKLVGKLYPQDLLNETLRLRDSCRK
jgi:TRAP-type transport system periplasmic protein